MPDSPGNPEQSFPPTESALAPDASADSPATETPETREARFRAAIDQALQLSRAAELDIAPPAKYSLGELMLVVTLLAVSLALMRAFGLWGATVTFVGCLAWTNLLYPRWHPQDQAQQALVFDLVWGLFMPVAALVCDPFVFKDHRELLEGAFHFQAFGNYEPNFRRESLAAYLCIAWQMILLMLWLLARPWLTRMAGFFLGSWIVGAMLAGVLGLLLVPLAVVGSFAGIGLVAFTPLFTTYVVSRRMKQAIDDGILDSSETSITLFWLLSAVGFILAWGIPLQLARTLRPILGIP
jgi:hypothetical protein